MPRNCTVNEKYLGICKKKVKVPWGIKWCKKKVWGVKIKYPCGIKKRTIKIKYPCIKTRPVEKICYDCDYIRMEKWGLITRNYCCEDGVEYGPWTRAGLGFGTDYGEGESTQSFDDNLKIHGDCDGPVDHQPRVPDLDPRDGADPSDDSGTVYSSTHALISKDKKKDIKK
ncbi:MAG: hypothetical protein KAS47_02575 [Candidatus Heimdallarchaeota archaeon]|nr:hypothetical protein [Candidatus Heimdallarchaeota archaeon]